MTNQNTAEQTATVTFANRSWLRRVVDRVFGYDIFVSYAHADGRDYALQLLKHLEKCGFECFFDSKRFRAGDNWIDIGHWSLRRSTCLVLVGSPCALDSKPVLREVSTFRGLKRQIMPISFDGSLDPPVDRSPLLKHFPLETLRLLNENFARLALGPSLEIINKIQNDFKGMRQDRWRFRLSLAAAIAFAIIAASAVWASIVAVEERQTAENERDRALYSNARSMANVAQREIDAGNVTKALKLGIDAIDSIDSDKPHPAEAQLVLYRGLQHIREKAVWRLAGTASIDSVSLGGTYGLVSYADGKTDLIDLKEARIIQTLEDLRGTLTASAFDLSGDRFATIDNQGGLTVRKIGDLSSLQTFTVKDVPATAVTFGADGALIAGFVDGVVRVWDLETQTLTSKFQAHSKRVAVIAASDDGDTIATASDTAGVSLWSLSSQSRFGKLRGHESRVLAMDFNPVAKNQLVTASSDGSAIIWNTAKVGVSEDELDRSDTFLIDTSDPNARQIRAVPKESITYLRGHRSRVVSVRYTGNSRIVTASDDGTMRIWDARTGALMQILAGHEDRVFNASWIGGGKGIVSVSGDGTLRYWNAVLEPNPPIKMPHPARYSVTWTHFSADGERVYTAAEPSNIYRWKRDGGAEDALHKTPFPYTQGPRIYVADIDAGRTVIATAGCCMLNQILVPSAYGVQIRKITDGTVEREILNDYLIRSVSFAPTGTLLLAITMSGEAILHDINNEEESAALQDLGGDVIAGVFGATADILAFSLSSGKIVIRKPHNKFAKRKRGSGGQISFSTVDGPAQNIAISDDGKYLMSCGPRNIARLWSARDGKLISALEGHTDDILSCAFSPNSRMALTTSIDQSARVWFVPEGDVFAIFDRHQMAVHLGEFANDNSTIATGSFDGHVRLFRLFPDASELLAAARAAHPESRTNMLSSGIAELFILPEKLSEIMTVEQSFPLDTSEREKSNREQLSLAISDFERGKVGKALVTLNELNLKLTELIQTSVDTLGQSLAYRGYAKFRQKAYDSARTDLDAAIYYSPKYPKAYLYRAYLYEVDGDFDQAISAYTAAISLNPRLARAYTGRAYVYRTLKMWDDAYDDISIALELTPSRTGYVGRAAIHQYHGRCQKALDDLNRAADIETKSPYVIHLVRKAFILATCPDDSIRDGDTAVEIIRDVLANAVPIGTPQYSEALYLSVLAAALAETGKFEEATEYQQHAVDKFRQEGDADKLKNHEERLRAYRNRQPWRESQAQE